MTDPQQFEAFVRAYQNMVYTTALRLLGRESDAEDIAQETFLRAYHRFSELAESPSAGGWLKTVTRNLSLNHLSRYRARWRFFSEMTTGDDGAEKEPEWAAPESHDAQMDAADRRRWIESALHRLPEPQRVALVLFYFDGLAYEEIAIRLRVSLAKIKTDIHRGRETLRKRLAQGAQGEALGLCGAQSLCAQ